MNNMIKGAMLVALATMGLGLSGCGSDTANANATATPDPAELTAAALDREAAAAPQAPADVPADKASEGAEPTAR